MYIYVYICSCPFSDDSKFIDLVQVYQVYKGLKNFPKHNNGDYVLCFDERIHSSPQAIHTKDTLYLQVDKGKEANILLVLGQ